MLIYSSHLWEEVGLCDSLADHSSHNTLSRRELRKDNILAVDP